VGLLYRITRQDGFQLLRYGVVGTSMSVLYASLATSIIEVTVVRPLTASVAAFCLSLPVAYLSHLYLTFRRARPQRPQFLRFVLAMSNALIVSTVVMWLTVSVFRAHYAYALAATTVMVIAVNYTVLDHWVFSAGSNKADVRGQERARGSP
jgi:putative flippase GtrA